MEDFDPWIISRVAPARQSPLIRLTLSGALFNGNVEDFKVRMPSCSSVSNLARP